VTYFLNVAVDSKPCVAHVVYGSMI
jgi:hypothetical protein